MSRAAFSIAGQAGRAVVLSGNLRLPRIEPLSVGEIRNRSAATALGEAKPSSAAKIKALAARLAEHSLDDPAFRDELEAYIEVRAPNLEFDLAKALTEFAVWKTMRGKHGPIHLMDEAQFLRLLMEVHRRLGTGQNAIRRGPVGLRPDSVGNRVVFPRNELVPAILRSAHQFLRQHAREYPMTTACAVFGAIMYAHPFNDGNGRTARTLYNLVLGSAVPTRHFVPIQLFSALYRPAFILKLRRALYGCDWVALSEFIGESVHLSRELQCIRRLNDACVE